MAEGVGFVPKFTIGDHHISKGGNLALKMPNWAQKSASLNQSSFYQLFRRASARVGLMELSVFFVVLLLKSVDLYAKGT